MPVWLGRHLSRFARPLKNRATLTQRGAGKRSSVWVGVVYLKAFGLCIRVLIHTQDCHHVPIPPQRRMENMESYYTCQCTPWNKGEWSLTYSRYCFRTKVWPCLVVSIFWIHSKANARGCSYNLMIPKMQQPKENINTSQLPKTTTLIMIVLNTTSIQSFWRPCQQRHPQSWHTGLDLEP